MQRIELKDITGISVSKGWDSGIIIHTNPEVCSLRTAPLPKLVSHRVRPQLVPDVGDYLLFAEVPFEVVTKLSLAAKRLKEVKIDNRYACECGLGTWCAV
jgi:hypothetical protein